MGYVAGIFAILGIMCLTIFLYLEQKFQLLQYNDGTVQYEGVIYSDEPEVIIESEIMKNATEKLQESQSILSEEEISEDTNVLNVLLIGTDERSEEFSDNARGDTCMLLSINKSTMAIKLVSFQRGMGVPILSGSYEGQYDWLTHTFRYGGADLMMKEIEECFRVEVDYYIRVNIYTFIKLIDCIGGVEIELTQAEADYINFPTGTYAELSIKEMGVGAEIQEVSKGYNMLNGATTMVYARCREIDSDWSRVQRQRNVISSMIEQVKTTSFSEWNFLLDEILPLVQTNFKQEEIMGVIPLMLNYSKISISQMTIPVECTYGSMEGMDGRKMYSVNFEENARILNEFIY